jgi:hypothetical protein
MEKMLIEPEKKTHRGGGGWNRRVNPQLLRKWEAEWKKLSNKYSGDLHHINFQIDTTKRQYMLRFRIRHKGKDFQKKFYLFRFGSFEGALLAAMEYRDKFVKENGVQFAPSGYAINSELPKVTIHQN